MYHECELDSLELGLEVEWNLFLVIRFSFINSKKWPHLPKIRHLLISHNAPYLSPQILHNLCFSFLLGITTVPREIENNANSKFWGQIRCIMGDVQVAYTSFWKNHNLIKHLGYVQESLILCKCIQQIQTYPFTNICH